MARVNIAAIAGSGKKGKAQQKQHDYVIRGIYEDEPDPDWQEVPTFETKEECAAWYGARTRCTNPKYPSCTHIYTHACDWEQVETLLLDKAREMRRKYPVERSPPAIPEENRFAESDAMRIGLRSRLRLPVHEVTTEEATLNSLRYLFVHMRSGIFVMIRRNRVVMFVPFVNKDYENTWGSSLELEDGMTVQQYYRKKRRRIREDVLPDKNQWWANGNIMCNVMSPKFWGDAYLTQLRHLLDSCCKERTVADCEFFINKRDFPHLKKDATEAYDFLFDQDGHPLDREAYASYAPIASFFVSHEFADVPLVTTDDWETATGRVFPPAGVDLRSARNRKQHAVPWKDRCPTAIFRGNSTGPGVLPADNQRLRLAEMSHDWQTDPALRRRFGPGNPVDGEPFLDAGVVGWNLRDRKMQGQPMTYIKKEKMRFSKVNKVPMYEQMRYKYHIYVDGHCAAMRYASMMPLGAVILKVSSITKADHIWYFPLLTPFDIHKEGPEHADHIPVKPDLSDLAEVIEWCKKNDAMCQRIAENSQQLYERLMSREGLLDYTQMMLRDIALRFRSHQDMRELLLGDDKEVAEEVRQAEAAASGDPAVELGDGAHGWAEDGCDWFQPEDREYATTRIGRSQLARPAVDGGGGDAKASVAEERRRRQQEARRAEAIRNRMRQQVKARLAKHAQSVTGNADPAAGLRLVEGRYAPREDRASVKRSRSGEEIG